MPIATQGNFLKMLAVVLSVALAKSAARMLLNLFSATVHGDSRGDCAFLLDWMDEDSLVWEPIGNAPCLDGHWGDER